jgi:uncharacterized membrane protein
VKRPVAVLALGLVVAAVGCTEAPTLDPGGSSTGAGGSSSGAGGSSAGAGGSSTDAGGAAAAPMVFVPYTPPGPAPSAGIAGQTGGGALAGMGGPTGAAGMGPIGTGGRATAGMTGAGGSVAATMLGLVPVAISRNGAVVAGVDEATGWHAVLWTPKTGALPLPGLRDVDDRGEVTFIGADGLVYGASFESATNVRRAIAWSPDTGAPSNPIAAGYPDPCTIVAAGDGATLAGTCTRPVGTKEAVRVVMGQPTGLGFLPGDTNSEAVAMSANGSTVVGASYNPATKSQRAFRWTAQTGMTELQPLFAGTFVLPRAVNANGSLIACDAWSGTPTFPGVAQPTSELAFLWRDGSSIPLDCNAPTPNARVVALSAKTASLLGACLPGNLDARAELPFVADMPPTVRLLPAPVPFDRATPIGISAAGEVVVAVARNVVPPAIVVWKMGMPIPLMMGPASPSSLELEVAALSEDGTTIVGDLKVANGPRRGWLMRTP